MSPELKAALEAARNWEKTATPEEKEAAWKAQCESWVRAFSTPCEHGELDFEQCPECVKEADERNAARRLASPEGTAHE